MHILEDLNQILIINIDLNSLGCHLEYLNKLVDCIIKVLRVLPDFLDHVLGET